MEFTSIREIALFIGWAIIIFMLAHIVSTFLRHVLRHIYRSMLKRRKNVAERLRKEGVPAREPAPPIFDETQFRIVSKLITGLLYIVAISIIVYSVPALRSLSYSLLAGAGVAAIVLGIALQKSLANIMAGAFIAFYEPFRIGDYIMFDDKYGIVEDINLRHTIIRNWENRRWVVPNALLTDTTVENHNIVDSKFLRVFTITVAYETDIDSVRSLILKEIDKYPQVIIPTHIETAGRTLREPFVRVVNWLDSGLELQVGFWTRSIQESWTPYYGLLEAIKKQFDIHGVEIPYPHRVMVDGSHKSTMKTSKTKKKVTRRKNK